MILYCFNLVDIVLSLLPNATDSINRLKDKPESLQKKGHEVKSNIESLQKKINICRDMVNRCVLNFISIFSINSILQVGYNIFKLL